MEPMVDVKKLEEMYGNPRSWWYDKAEKGEIPSFKLGKYRRFRISEIEAWLLTKRQATPSRAAAAR